MSKYNITEWTCGIGLMSGTSLDGRFGTLLFSFKQQQMGI